MVENLPVDIFRQIVAKSTNSRSILDLWELNDVAKQEISAEIRKLSKKSPIRVDIRRFFRENNPFLVEFYEIGNPEHKKQLFEKIRELTRLLEKLSEIGVNFQLDNLNAAALGFQAENDEQYIDKVPFMLQKKLMVILQKFQSPEISISRVFMRPSRMIGSFRDRAEMITSLDLGNARMLAAMHLRSKIFPSLKNLEKLVWNHANINALRKIPNKEKLKILDLTCHVVGRPTWEDFQILADFQNLENFYFGLTVPNKPTRMEMDILLNLYQAIWRQKMGEKNDFLIKTYPKIKEIGFWNAPEKIFQMLSKHSIRIETLNFGEISQNLRKMCSFDSILQAFFKFEEAENVLEQPDIQHLNMNLHTMPAVGLDYYLPNVMSHVNRIPSLKSVSLFVKCIFHQQMTSSWSMESKREKSSRRRPVIDSTYTHFSFHSEGLCGLKDLDRQLPPTLESCTISLNLPSENGHKVLKSVVEFIQKLGDMNDFPELVEFHIQILGVACFELLTNAIHDSLGPHLRRVSILAPPRNLEKSTAKRLLFEIPGFFPKIEKIQLGIEFLRIFIKEEAQKHANWPEKIRKLGRKVGFSMENVELTTCLTLIPRGFVPRGEEPTELPDDFLEDVEEEEEDVLDIQNDGDEDEEMEDEDDGDGTIVYEESEDELEVLERKLHKESDRRHKKWETKRRIEFEEEEDEEDGKHLEEEENDESVVDWNQLDEQEEEEDVTQNQNGMFDDEAEEGETEEEVEDEEEEPEGEDLADSDDERLFVTGPNRKRKWDRQQTASKRRRIVVSDEEDEE